MTFNILFRIFLILAMIWQIIIVLTAEHGGEYAKATYEMLWLFFFIHLADKEFEK